jgi:hypothetical protein
MGQFLWIEQANSEIRMLDHFLQLLAFGVDGQVAARPLYGVRLLDVEKAARARCDQEIDTESRWKFTTFYDEVSR